MSEACFTAADILLPAAGVPLDPWACIAVDQFTSQPEYWQRAEHLADGKPSTLHIVLPEAYLGTPQEAERVASIRRTMEEYRKSVLTRKVHGYVYAGCVLGLVLLHDLRDPCYGVPYGQRLHCEVDAVPFQPQHLAAAQAVQCGDVDDGVEAFVLNSGQQITHL